MSDLRVDFRRGGLFTASAHGRQRYHTATKISEYDDRPSAAACVVACSIAVHLRSRPSDGDSTCGYKKELKVNAHK